MAPRKGKKEKTEEVQVQLGPQVREGVEVFGVAHIYASFNDTFVHVTDLSGRETLCRVTGGMYVCILLLSKSTLLDLVNDSNEFKMTS